MVGKGGGLCGKGGLQSRFGPKQENSRVPHPPDMSKRAAPDSRLSWAITFEDPVNLRTVVDAVRNLTTRASFYVKRFDGEDLASTAPT